jgi:hypothetical protein
LGPYIRQEAETIAWAQGIKTEPCSQGPLNVWSINDGDNIKVKGVGFDRGARTFKASVASAEQGGIIELWLDSTSGLLIGSCQVPRTGGWQDYTTASSLVDIPAGTHDLFFVIRGEGAADLFNFDWWQFQ